MEISNKPLSETSKLEREEMIQRFKNASVEDKAAMYEQFKAFRSENVSEKDRMFLQELEADMKAYDFSEWEAEE